MFLLGLFCFALVVATAFRDTPIGRVLHRALIQAPADHLSKGTVSSVLAHCIVLAALAVALLLAANMQDGIVILWAMPDVLAWLAAFDAVTLLELTIAVGLTALNVRVSALLTAARIAILRIVGRVRRSASQRARRPRRPRKIRDSDETDEAPSLMGWAWAA